ncbi:Putative protein-S-isoprenylcysteine methyltransferase [Halapricum desulfuricans]|uniref:Isoprenylcysteine carboxylmethyltransferase family protein n=1 Tax=Halapricum desulfuricans TaxID=2841257 RepID=A0A897NRT0_9EURY|nr:methyltransferase [Halapricum desulfuricans]QSG12906.1 Putative protein-S-isoprenylcysteine methyltransferase [Halapricum desulfuricans]
MSATLLAIGLTGAALQFVLTGQAAIDAERRPWPPDEITGRFGLYWLLVMSMAGSFFTLIATTSGSLYPVGVVSILGGGAFVLGAAVNVLTADEFEGPEEILGLEWNHHADGPFRFSRNPEVAGHAGAVAGLAVAAGSWQAMVLAGAIVGWFAVRPLAEEPVLAERYGDRYEDYRSRVGRYVDRERLSEAFGPCRNDCP